MRQKTKKIVFAFPSTTDAMAMATVCPKELGRLIPLPASISAGCGLAWCCQPGQEEKVIAIAEAEGLQCEGPYEEYFY